MVLNRCRTLALMLLLLPTMALCCTGDCDEDPTGPGNPDPEPTGSIQGTWTLESGGSGVSNDYWSAGGTGFTAVLELNQSGSRISGRSHSGRSSGSVIGWGAAEPLRVAVPADSVYGTLQGSTVIVNVRTGSREASRSDFQGTLGPGGMTGNGWSAVRGGHSVPPAPAAPSNLMVAGWEPSGAIHFRWDDNSSDEEGFVFFEVRDVGSPRVIGTVESNTQTATYAGPCLGDVSCEYWIHAYRFSDGTLSDRSNVVEVYRDDLVGSSIGPTATDSNR